MFSSTVLLHVLRNKKDCFSAERIAEIFLFCKADLEIFNFMREMGLLNVDSIFRASYSSMFSLL